MWWHRFWQAPPRTGPPRPASGAGSAGAAARSCGTSASTSNSQKALPKRQNTPQKMDADTCGCCQDKLYYVNL